MRNEAASPNTWATYLYRAVRRPGWNATRLANESGVNRVTIHRWIKGEVTNVTTAKVRAVAEALGDDPATALRAAGMLNPEPRSDAPPTPAELAAQLRAATTLSDGVIDRLVAYYTGYWEQQQAGGHAV